jgi:hypothetical protein
MQQRWQRVHGEIHIRVHLPHHVHNVHLLDERHLVEPNLRADFRVSELG